MVAADLNQVANTTLILRVFVTTRAPLPLPSSRCLTAETVEGRMSACEPIALTELLMRTGLRIASKS
jgi:hypothetical protein